jgi:hypothetical protein
VARTSESHDAPAGSGDRSGEPRASRWGWLSAAAAVAAWLLAAGSTRTDPDVALHFLKDIGVELRRAEMFLFSLPAHPVVLLAPLAIIAAVAIQCYSRVTSAAVAWHFFLIALAPAILFAADKVMREPVFRAIAELQRSRP